MPNPSFKRDAAKARRPLTLRRADALGRSAAQTIRQNRYAFRPIQAIIPAATVLFVASSMTMKLPVARSVV